MIKTADKSTTASVPTWVCQPEKVVNKPNSWRASISSAWTTSPRRIIVSPAAMLRLTGSTFWIASSLAACVCSSLKKLLGATNAEANFTTSSTWSSERDKLTKDGSCWRASSRSTSRMSFRITCSRMTTASCRTVCQRASLRSRICLAVS